jgi:hypothetical protein
MGLISLQLVWLGLGAIVVTFHSGRLALTVWRNLKCAEKATETWQEDCRRQALGVLPAWYWQKSYWLPSWRYWPGYPAFLAAIDKHAIASAAS